MFIHFVDNEQFNFQINRAAVYGPACMDVEEVKRIAPYLKDVGSWTEEWLKLGELAYKEKRYGHAVYYYRMAEFYMSDHTEEKLKCYKAFRKCFELAHQAEHIQRFEVPYENTYLPAIRLKAEKEKGIVVVHGGYDSFMEEFYPLIKEFPQKGYTIIMFEGPGQGQARKNGLVFSYNWEKPASAILDYFSLKDITLLGISWGGYLAPRAAAFDKRIKNVICYDIWYWGLDVLLNRMPNETGEKLQVLLNNGQKEILNGIISEKMKMSIDLNWKVTHGMYITGTSTPYDFLKEIDKHKLSDCAERITQNVLLLAGEKDMYVPVRRMEQIKKELVNAASVTSRVFTEVEGGAQHCQVGNYELVKEEIQGFLEKYI